jgi:Protein of unknown function (DUF2851)
LNILNPLAKTYDKMREDFLHYLWRTRRFDLTDLKTTKGETIEIQDFGEHNHDAGPDFLNSTIRIGDMVWAGNVEMHVKASEWTQHKHQTDKAYNNVILHVVFEENEPVFKENTEGPPTLELRGRIPEGIAQKYWALMHNEHWIPCQQQFYTVSELTKTMWMERLLVERLEDKTEAIAASLNQNKMDWEETFYQFIARSFGAKVNAEPMEWLARSLPHRILAKHKNNLFQVESLIFGQSGLLDKGFEDEYPTLLSKEHTFLSHKHQLTPIETVAWKFSKLRPNNFPTIRLAQLASLVHQSTHLFSKVLESDSIENIKALFDVKISEYWHTHYTFDTPSVLRPKTIGDDAFNLILINTIIPFLFYYGKMKKEEVYKDRAFAFLEQLKPESNNITEGWQRLGLEPKSAFNSQALIQLKNKYCDKKRCLECAIGNGIVK